MSEPNQNGEHGVDHQRVTVIQVAYNQETTMVSFSMKDVPISLAQMMLDEAVRQLDIMRRQAAAMQLRQQMVDQQLMDEIAGKARGGR